MDETTNELQTNRKNSEQNERSKKVNVRIKYHQKEYKETN